MSEIKKNNKRNLVLLLMIISAALLRILNVGKFGDWANFTPVGAIALFAGTYFKDRWMSFLVPILTLFISDIIVNYGYFGKITLLYDGIFWVYLAFAAMVFIGKSLKKVTITGVITVAIAGVVAHWLISNFGVWLGGEQFGNLYTHNIQGFIQCYVNAIPFEKNLLLGNLAYGAILYGGFEWAKRSVPNLAEPALI